MGLADGEDRSRSEKKSKRNFVLLSLQKIAELLKLKFLKLRELTLQNIEGHRCSGSHSFYKESEEIWRKIKTEGDQNAKTS